MLLDYGARTLKMNTQTKRVRQKVSMPYSFPFIYHPLHCPLRQPAFPSAPLPFVGSGQSLADQTKSAGCHGERAKVSALWRGGVGGSEGGRVSGFHSSAQPLLLLSRSDTLWIWSGEMRGERSQFLFWVGSFAFFSLSRRGNATDVRLCDSV